LRLQLLDIEAPYHAPLLKSIYGLLMCIPQGDAFRLLNDRLTAVCNLRDNLGVSVAVTTSKDAALTVTSRGLDMEKLLQRFDDVIKQHQVAKEYAQKIATIQQSKLMDQPELRGPSMLAASSSEGQASSSLSVPSRANLPSQQHTEKSSATNSNVRSTRE
jgi:hypothetical protein